MSAPGNLKLKSYWRVPSFSQESHGFHSLFLGRRSVGLDAHIHFTVFSQDFLEKLFPYTLLDLKEQIMLSAFSLFYCFLTVLLGHIILVSNNFCQIHIILIHESLPMFSEPNQSINNCTLMLLDLKSTLSAALA